MCKQTPTKHSQEVLTNTSKTQPKNVDEHQHSKMKMHQQAPVDHNNLSC
jgi:hypothetical protein